MWRKFIVRVAYTDEGAFRSFDAGQVAFARYSDLVQSNNQVPFVRTTSSARVVQSAENWSAGIVHSSHVVLTR